MRGFGERSMIINPIGGLLISPLFDPGLSYTVRALGIVLISLPVNHAPLLSLMLHFHDFNQCNRATQT